MSAVLRIVHSDSDQFFEYEEDLGNEVLVQEIKDLPDHTQKHCFYKIKYTKNY
jgi:hypothetical protein